MFNKDNNSCFTGTLPLVLTINVSPPGKHFVRIVSSTGGDDTVSYTVRDTDSDSTLTHVFQRTKLKLAIIIYA